MTAKGALRLEAFIIGLGILALILIFQPFSMKLLLILLRRPKSTPL